MMAWTRFAVKLAVSAVTAWAAGAADASQGPGTSPGAAGSVTQLAMAIAVYGACAAIVGAGLIGLLRKR